MRTDYYGALNVSKSANATEIKSKYRRLALQYHPDKLGHLTKSQQKSAEKIFKVPPAPHTVDTVSSSYHAYRNTFPSSFDWPLVRHVIESATHDDQPIASAASSSSSSSRSSPREKRSSPTPERRAEYDDTIAMLPSFARPKWGKKSVFDAEHVKVSVASVLTGFATLCGGFRVGESGAFTFITLVPVRPRRRGERRSLRTFAGVSLRPPLAFQSPPSTPFNSN